MINVNYACSALGASGYSEAARNYIAALNLYNKEVNLAVRSVSFETWQTDQSAYMSILAPLIKKKIEPDINVVHMTPENFLRYKVQKAKNIGYTVWETTSLPNGWAAACNQMDKVLVPCDWNIEVFKNSGVTVPVEKVEHTIDLDQFDAEYPNVLNLPKDKFVFYSIFQWTERKNPIGLIRAFLAEFNKDKDVVLVLKTYKQNATPEDKKIIESEINNCLKTVHIEHYPPVVLLHKMLSRQEIISLHQHGSCLVLPHKAEGWGCTQFEAMACGKPVISTRFGGNTEFMNDENSYLVDYNLTPVAGMPWKLYNGNAMWAEPHLDHLMAQMREVYSNYNVAKEKAKIGKKNLEKYKWSEIGLKMINSFNL
jgi:glycosyltransferase involved in cell wall biosynthesis